jgi:hypothetical protein
MSYCRFQNTLSDLRDCYDALQEIESFPLVDADDDEGHAMMSLIKLCTKISDEFNTEDSDL